jgi:hypothetical protein
VLVVANAGGGVAVAVWCVILIWFLFLFPLIVPYPP